jgi:hypothetical protein
MSKEIIREWKEYKEELKINLEKTIERNNSDTAVIEIMLKMLENTKLKDRRDKKYG